MALPLCSLCYLLLNFPALGDTITFSFHDGLGNPITNTECIFTQKGISANGPLPGLTTSATFSIFTDSNGSNSSPNFQGGIWNGHLKSNPDTYFQIIVPGDGGTHFFGSLLSNLSTLPQGIFLNASNTSGPSNFLTLTTNGTTISVTFTASTNATIPSYVVTNNYSAPVVLGSNLNVNGAAVLSDGGTLAGAFIANGASIVGLTGVTAQSVGATNFIGNGEWLTNVNTTANKWFVEKDGSDSNPGNQAGPSNAFFSVDHAVSVVSNIVRANPSSYNIIHVGIGNFPIVGGTNGTFLTNNTLLIGESPLQTILSFPTSAPNVGATNIGIKIWGSNIEIVDICIGTNSHTNTYDEPLVPVGGSNFYSHNMKIDSASDNILAFGGITGEPLALSNYFQGEFNDGDLWSGYDAAVFGSTGAGIGSRIVFNGVHFHVNYITAFGTGGAPHGIRNETLNGINIAVDNCTFDMTNNLAEEAPEEAAAIFCNAGNTTVGHNVFNLGTNVVGIALNGGNFYQTAPLDMADVDNTLQPGGSSWNLPNIVAASFSTYDNASGNGLSDFMADSAGNIYFSALDGGGTIIYTNKSGVAKTIFTNDTFENAAFINSTTIFETNWGAMSFTNRYTNLWTNRGMATVEISCSTGAWNCFLTRYNASGTKLAPLALGQGNGGAIPTTNEFTFALDPGGWFTITNGANGAPIVATNFIDL